MKDLEHVPRPNTVVPKIPNLISKLHPHYGHIESVARIEHKQVNDRFLERLRTEQAPWINEIKHSLQYNDNTHPSTQKWVNTNMIVEIDGIMVRRIDTILVPASMRDELMEMLHIHGTTNRPSWGASHI